MNSFKRALLIVSVLAQPLSVQASPRSCGALFRPQIEARVLRFETETANLSEFRSRELRLASVGQVRRMNGETVREFTDYKPMIAQAGRRGSEAEYSQLQKLLEILKTHPVVGRDNRERYQRPEKEIGYCFGRAFYLQLMLLKLGLNPDSIRKIWLVGPQKNPDGANWGFHVATAAYVRGYGWMAIDTNTFKIQPIRHWQSSFYENSLDGLARFYVTDAKRFTADFAKLSRVQLGLDLAIESDWYRHYFVDLIKDVRTSDVEALGLTPVSRSQGVTAKEPPTETGASWLGEFKDFFGL